VSYSDAHYAGSLVDGAYSLALFGDVATDLCIANDGDEGLFASYQDVQFLAPITAGDVVEATGTIVDQGERSRQMRFECTVVARSSGAGSSHSAVLDPPILAVTALGTVVVARP
jgi:3-aminobutyryl-CoA ammonia-lyase